jgi:predicted phosphodiesterase
MISKETAVEVFSIIDDSANRKKAMRDLARQRGVSINTIERYYRYGAIDARQGQPKAVKTQRDKYLDKLRDMPEEVLKAFVKTGTEVPVRRPVQKIKLNKKSFKIGFFTDSHMGNHVFREDWWFEMVDDFNRNEIDVCLCAGDVTDGLYTHRKGHVFELSHLGYIAQRDYAIEMLSYLKQPFYAISGNHDLTYQKDIDADIVEEICNGLPNATYIGKDIGDVKINDIIIRLFHGGGGSAYALSYRLQKYVEQIQGGDKPDILLSGHTHKSFYMPSYRNIECFSGGAMCEQSDWMMATLKGNHSGYWVINVEYDKKGLYAVSGRFKPFFMEPIEKIYN